MEFTIEAPERVVRKLRDAVGHFYELTDKAVDTECTARLTLAIHWMEGSIRNHEVAFDGRWPDPPPRGYKLKKPEEVLAEFLEHCKDLSNAENKDRGWGQTMLSHTYFDGVMKMNYAGLVSRVGRTIGHSARGIDEKS